MNKYIACKKKRNEPRMDIRVCQAKCDLKKDCPGFQNHPWIKLHNRIGEELDRRLGGNVDWVAMGLEEG